MGRASRLWRLRAEHLSLHPLCSARPRAAVSLTLAAGLRGRCLGGAASSWLEASTVSLSAWGWPASDDGPPGRAALGISSPVAPYFCLNTWPRGVSSPGLCWELRDGDWWLWRRSPTSPWLMGQITWRAAPFIQGWVRSGLWGTDWLISHECCRSSTATALPRKQPECPSAGEGKQTVLPENSTQELEEWTVSHQCFSSCLWVYFVSYLCHILKYKNFLTTSFEEKVKEVRKPQFGLSKSPVGYTVLGIDVG